MTFGSIDCSLLYIDVGRVVEEAKERESRRSGADVLPFGGSVIDALGCIHVDCRLYCWTISLASRAVGVGEVN